MSVPESERGPEETSFDLNLQDQAISVTLVPSILHPLVIEENNQYWEKPIPGTRRWTMLSNAFFGSEYTNTNTIPLGTYTQNT